MPVAGLKDPVDLEMSLDAAEECLRGGSTIALASEDLDFLILVRKASELSREQLRRQLQRWGCHPLLLLPRRAKSRQG